MTHPQSQFSSVPSLQNCRPTAGKPHHRDNRSLKIAAVGAAISALAMLFPTQAFGVTLVTNRAVGINALSIVQPVPEPVTIVGTIIGGTAV
jgi:hypothetical protein